MIPFQVADIIVFLYDIGTSVVDFQICTVERDCPFFSWIGPLLCKYGLSSSGGTLQARGLCHCGVFAIGDADRDVVDSGYQ